MRKLSMVLAAALAAALIPLAAVAAPPGQGGQGQGQGQKQVAPRAHWFAGSVASASSSSVSVNVLWTGPHDGQLKGQTVAVALDSSTQIVYGKGQTSIDPGDLVAVKATATDSTLASLTAVKLRVACNCHWLGGTIGSIGTSSLTVQVAKTGPFDTVLKDQTVTLQLNGSTQYVKGKDKTPISLSDLKVGDKVGVVFGADGFFKDPSFDPSKATFTAKLVHLWAGKQVPPPASDSGASADTNP